MTATPERTVYLHVILRAVLDAHAVAARDRQARQEARDWFEQAGPDFRAVCHLAGLEPEIVQAAWRQGRLAQLVRAEPDARGRWRDVA